MSITLKNHTAVGAYLNGFVFNSFECYYYYYYYFLTLGRSSRGSLKIMNIIIITVIIYYTFIHVCIRLSKHAQNEISESMMRSGINIVMRCHSCCIQTLIGFYL